MLAQKQHILAVQTAGPGFTNISASVQAWLDEIGATDGVLTLFVRHTSASLTIQENADPDVLNDLGDWLDDMAPQNRRYRHDCEGPDDMPAHIKCMITSTSLTIPVREGRPAFGTWQSPYLVEHRARAHRREIVLHFQGEMR